MKQDKVLKLYHVWFLVFNSLTPAVNSAPKKECLFRLERRFSVESEEFFRAGSKVEMTAFYKHIH